ncbi:hypothetical protein PR202_gb28996 [Eleusine coracana subsp. coracana]|uniref:Uncharacterized protein n=1 Tax=Eleusine coracana subsp. coracana TaxID=191504 RepID=A0AAV5FYJ1_ELECO|nr:hypothetical protein PR202_gb28996 [Eleusine coracana subsp. coracana]
MSRTTKDLHILLGTSACCGCNEEFQWASLCMDQQFLLALASSVFSFCFETLVVMEHEKLDQKQDLLFDTFWLMTLFESVSLIGSQGITNLLVNDDSNGFLVPYAFAAALSIVGILYIRNASSATQHASAIGSYQKSFFAHVLRGE